MSTGDVGDHSLTAGHAVVAAMGEERLRFAGGAAVEAIDARNPGRAERALGARPEVEIPAVHDVVAEALTVGRGNLLPHLVAARANCRSDRRRDRAAAERVDARSDDAREKPLPARVEDGDRGRPVAADKGDRQT